MISNSSIKVRVKKQKALRLILSTNISYSFILRLLGGQLLYRLKYPKKRIDIFLNTFFADIDVSTGKMNRFSWQSLFSNISAIDKKDSDSFANIFFKHSIEYMRQNKKFRKYFKKMTRHVLLNEVYRESLPEEHLLTFLTVDVTQRCNMYCTHCFANASPTANGSLNIEDAKRFINEAKNDGGLRLVAILGGEPLLEVDKIIELSVQFPYTPFIVFSNGTLITEEILQKFKPRYNIGLFISIEGFCELTDQIRGSKSFDQANAALIKLRESGIVFGVSVTANKKNYKEIVSDSFADYLDSMGCYFFWIFDYKAIGRAGEDDSMRNLVIGEEEQEYINNAVMRLNKRAGFLCINTEKGPAVLGGCPAHKGTGMHISCKGFITPCVAVRHYRDDININNHSYLDVVHSEFLDSFKKIGHGAGCPNRHYPQEFAEWCTEQGTKNLGI